MRLTAILKKFGLHLIAVLALLAMAFFFFWPFIQGQLSFIWDTREFGFPNLHFVTSNLSQLRFPLWNELKFSGYPAAGDIEVSMFYPITWLFALLFGHLPFADLAYYLFFHFFLGALSAYLLFHHFTKNPFASFAGAIVFAFSGYALGHLSHLGQVVMYQWIPVVFYAFIVALEKRQWFFTLLAGLTFGISILVGHYNTCVYILLGLFLLSAYQLVISKERLKTGIHAFSAVCFAILVASVLVFPVFQLALQSNRNSLTYEQQSKGWSLNPSDLLGFVDPNHNHVLEPEPLKQFNGSVDITQNYLYIGLLPLLLILLGLFYYNPYSIYFAVLGSIALLAAFGNHTPVNWLFFKGFPGFNKARMAVQIMCLFYFSASALTAFGAAKALDWLRKPKLRHTILFVSIFLCTIISIDILYHGFDRRFYSESVNPSNVFNTSTEAQLISAVKQGSDVPFRISDEVSTLMPNKWEYYGVENVFGNGGIRIKKYNDLFERTGPTNFKAISDDLYDFLNVKYVFTDRVLLSDHFRKVDLAGIPAYQNLRMLPRAYFVDGFQIEPSLSKQLELLKDSQIDLSSAVLLQKHPRYLGDNVSEGLDQKIRFSEKEPQRIRIDVQTPHRAILVFSEVDFDGWQLKVDGKPEMSFIANVAFRAVPLKAGTHTIEFAYKPTSVYFGAVVSLVSLLFFIFLTAFYFYGKRRSVVSKLRPKR